MLIVFAFVLYIIIIYVIIKREKLHICNTGISKGIKMAQKDYKFRNNLAQIWIAMQNVLPLSYKIREKFNLII